MLALLLSLMACDLQDGGQACNLMYSPSMLTIELTAEWNGAIQIDGSGGGDQISCVLAEAESAAACDDGISTIELSGDLLVVSLEQFVPDSLELTVVDDNGAELFTLEPSYSIDEPNGPGCGERRLGTESITL